MQWWPSTVIVAHRHSQCLAWGEVFGYHDGRPSRAPPGIFLMTVSHGAPELLIMLTISRQSGQRIYYRLAVWFVTLLEHVKQILDEPPFQQIWSDIIFPTISYIARMSCTKGSPKLSNANVVMSCVLISMVCKVLFRYRRVSFFNGSTWYSSVDWCSIFPRRITSKTSSRVISAYPQHISNTRWSKKYLMHTSFRWQVTPRYTLQ